MHPQYIRYICMRWARCCKYRARASVSLINISDDKSKCRRGGVWHEVLGIFRTIAKRILCLFVAVMWYLLHQLCCMTTMMHWMDKFTHNAEREILEATRDARGIVVSFDSVIGSAPTRGYSRQGAMSCQVTQATQSVHHVKRRRHRVGVKFCRTIDYIFQDFSLTKMSEAPLCLWRRRKHTTVTFNAPHLAR